MIELEARWERYAEKCIKNLNGIKDLDDFFFHCWENFIGNTPVLDKEVRGAMKIWNTVIRQNPRIKQYSRGLYPNGTVLPASYIMPLELEEEFKRKWKI